MFLSLNKNAQIPAHFARQRDVVTEEVIENDPHYLYNHLETLCVLIVTL